jgi:hypothetical protein
MTPDANQMFLDDLLFAAAEAAEDSGSYTTEELAGIALDLANVHAEVNGALAPLKVLLRTKARTRLDSPSGVVTVEGVDEAGLPLGTVTITFPRKQVKVLKDLELGDLLDRLGPLFSEYFEMKLTEKVVPKKGFAEALTSRLASGDADTEEGDLVLSQVEYSEPTPRVGFHYVKVT